MTIPTKLKLLRGRTGHHSVAGPEPEPFIPDVVPDPPAQLGEDAATEWRRIAPEVFRLGLLTIVDVHLLSGYCQAYERWITAEKGIAAMAVNDPKFFGLVVRNSQGHIVQNPLVRVAGEAMREMMAFAVQFGLTPVSRMKLASPTKKPPRKFDGLVVSWMLAKAKRSAKGKERAANVIRFIEKLTVPSGKGEGKPFKLQKWQKDFIRDIYEPALPDGRRVVRRAILSMGRKNGKTALIACIALAHLIGPERVNNGEIYSAANDRDQAAIIFKFARQIIEREPELLQLVDIVVSTKTMIGRSTGSVYRAISAEAGTKHGYLPSVVIYDELAQAKNRDLYDVLDTSFGARDEPLFITISTQSNDPQHILSQLIDDGLSGADPSIVCHLHAAKEECDLADQKQWKKANPALDVFRDRADLAAAIDKARRMPADEPKVRNLLLNQRVSPASPLISHSEWMACAGEVSFQPGEDVYLALDLSNTLDLSCLLMGSADDVARVQPFFWKPADGLAEQSFRDFGSGNYRYVEWENAGFIETTPGRSIDKEAIARRIAELSGRYSVRALVYDRWRIEDLLREFDRIGLQAYKLESERDDAGVKRYVGYEARRAQDGLRLVGWGQGFKDMAPAIDAFETAIKERKLLHPSNPCLTWNMANAIAVTDPAGNRKLDREKSRFRIDGAVALSMLCGIRSRDRARPKIDVDTLIG